MIIAVNIGIGTADESKLDGVKPKIGWSSSLLIISLAGSSFSPSSRDGWNSVDFLILVADKASGAIHFLDSARCRRRDVEEMNATAGGWREAPILLQTRSIKHGKTPLAVIIVVEKKINPNSRGENWIDTGIEAKKLQKADKKPQRDIDH
jgi:hypothetical protein